MKKLKLFLILIIVSSISFSQDILRTIGLQEQTHGGASLYLNTSDEGSQIIGIGYSGLHTTIFKTDLSGNLISDYHQEILPGQYERVNRARYDSDNDELVAVGGGDFFYYNSKPFYIKWGNVSLSPTQIHNFVEDASVNAQYHDIIECNYTFNSGSSNNYLTVGMTEHGSNPNDPVLALQSIFDRNSGFYEQTIPTGPPWNMPARPWHLKYSLDWGWGGWTNNEPEMNGDINSEFISTLNGNSDRQINATNITIQTAGPSGPGQHRASIQLVSHDVTTANGRYYHPPGNNTNCRFYADAVIESLYSGEFGEVLMFHGDDDGIDENDYKIYLSFTSVGQLFAPFGNNTTEISIDGYSTIRPKSIRPYVDEENSENDGYLILGEVGPVGQSDVFIMKVDITLEPQWCKIPTKYIGNSTVYATNPDYFVFDDNVYFTFTSDAYPYEADRPKIMFCRTEMSNTGGECIRNVETTSRKLTYEEEAVYVQDWYMHEQNDVQFSSIDDNNYQPLVDANVCFNCDSWVKECGDPAINDGATAVAEDQNGLFVAGYRDNNSTVSYYTKGGMHVYTNTINLIGVNSAFRVRDMIMDGSDLVMVGHTGLGPPSRLERATIVKYNPTTNNIIWVRRESSIVPPANSSDPVRSYFNTISQIPNSADYLLTSVVNKGFDHTGDIQMRTCTPGGVLNAPNTHTTTLPGTVSIKHTNVDDFGANNTYAGGRLSFPTGPTFRPYIANYNNLNNTPNIARTYALPGASIPSPNQIHWWGVGPVFFDNDPNNDLYLANYNNDVPFTDPSTNMLTNLSIMRVDPASLQPIANLAISINGYDLYWVHEIVSNEEGLYLYGDARQIGNPGNRDLFILFMDPDFNSGWVRTLDNSMMDRKQSGNKGLISAGSHLFFVGETNVAGTVDHLVGKIKNDGSNLDCYNDPGFITEFVPTNSNLLTWTNTADTTAFQNQMSFHSSISLNCNDICECEDDDNGMTIEYKKKPIKMNSHENEGISSIQSNIKIYPNPTKGVLNISLNDKDAEMIQVFNYQGKLVKTIENGSQSKNLQIDISQLPKGLYIISINTSNEFYNYKITLQ